MPEIAVAANIAAAPKATPGADSSSTSAASTGDASSQGPFAAVLQRQMDTADQPDAATAAVDAAVARDPLPTDIAAFLPMLMGSAAMTDSASGQPTAQATKATGSDNTETDAATAIPLFAPAPVIASASASPTTATDAKAPVESAGNSSTPTATMPAPATANLAAAPDSAGAAKPAAKTGQPFDALVADNLRSVDTPQSALHAAAAAATAAAAGTVNDAAARGHVVDSTVGSQAWNTDIGNRLVWMANNQASRAELVLTPPQLGKIEISVTMSGHDATATFVSASPVVRDAIESAIPRLREILADAGVTLGQTQVGSDAPRQETNQFRDNSFAGPAAVSSGALRVSASGVASWTGSGRGLVDVFA